jgi:hypothetical protein
LTSLSSVLVIASSRSDCTAALVRRTSAVSAKSSILGMRDKRLESDAQILDVGGRQHDTSPMAPSAALMNSVAAGRTMAFP